MSFEALGAKRKRSAKIRAAILSVHVCFDLLLLAVVAAVVGRPSTRPARRSLRLGHSHASSAARRLSMIADGRVCPVAGRRGRANSSNGRSGRRTAGLRGSSSTLAMIVDDRGAVTQCVEVAMAGRLGDWLAGCDRSVADHLVARQSVLVFRGCGISICGIDARGLELLGQVRIPDGITDPVRRQNHLSIFDRNALFDPVGAGARPICNDDRGVLAVPARVVRDNAAALALVSSLGTAAWLERTIIPSIFVPILLVI